MESSRSMHGITFEVVTIFQQDRITSNRLLATAADPFCAG